jgi:hypothetical protein
MKELRIEKSERLEALKLIDILCLIPHCEVATKGMYSVMSGITCSILIYRGCLFKIETSNEIG